MTTADDGWYHNERFGFALQMPEKLTHPGSCILSEAPAEGYRVTAFEDGSSIYLAPNAYGEMILKDPGDQAGGKDCVRINNKLSTIRKNIKDPLLYSYGWRMVADESISNDDQLLAFVREWHGPGCSLGAQSATEHEGTFDVEILSSTENNSPESSTCSLEAGYALKYSPSRHTAVTWKTGRENRFGELDRIMIESFRFE